VWCTGGRAAVRRRGDDVTLEATTPRIGALIVAVVAAVAVVDGAGRALNEMINAIKLTQMVPCESVGTRLNRFRTCNI
jgi:mannose/fructose/N-acetylgalactosamine-specific phosphotransferase system component IID